MEVLSSLADRENNRSLGWLVASSALVHGLILLGIFSMGLKAQRFVIKGPVYTVNLVEVPPGAKAARLGLAPPVRKGALEIKRQSLELPSKRALKLPSKEKLRRPPALKTLARRELPAPKAKPAPKKKHLVGTLGASSQARASLGIDAAVFPFPYYLRAVEQKIASYWEPVVHGIGPGETRHVVVAFRIRRDGSIVKPFIEKSSGLSYFDQSALRAVVRAAPLPPLPEGFPEETLGVHFGFQYQPEG
jgi:TonB family protein